MGKAGQERLRRARVATAGVGRLVSTVTIYLEASGIRTIGLIDHDDMRLANLYQQILHYRHSFDRTFLKTH
jgi:molybdopterin/thiamine biosynthesis adenylyltransferase